MRLIEDSNSPIRTLEDAVALRDFALHDLEDPTPDTSVRIDELYTDPVLHDMVQFQFTDYTINVGVTGINTEIHPDAPWGITTISGTIDKVIGLRNYWLGQELTEAEIAKRRLEFLTGGTSRLPQPVVLHYRKYSKQGADGETYSVVNIHWERVDSWWYGHTAIYVSIGDNKHYGEEPIATIRGTYAIVQPLPSGSEIWLKLRHFPNSLMSPQGRS